MYADHSITEAVGQAIIAIYFIWQGVKNVLLWDVNVARLRDKGLPGPLSLTIGFALQFTGAFLVLFDWQTEAGSILLIVFTLLATAIFHRYWTMTDPQRTYHFLLMSCNFCITGALLLLL